MKIMKPFDLISRQKYVVTDVFTHSICSEQE